MLLNRIPYIDKVLFTKNLSVMIKSGIPIMEAIAIVEDQTNNSSFKKVLKTIGEDVANGKSLNFAVAKHCLLYTSDAADE